MEYDQNGMIFKSFKSYLTAYCNCVDDQWDPRSGYYVFINPLNNQESYLDIVEYVDLIAIYRICTSLKIPIPPHFIDVEIRVRKLLENLKN